MEGSHHRSVGDHMSQLEEFSDLALRCEGHDVKVHKVIVCAQSPVLKAVVTGGFQESHTGVVQINRFRLSIVKYMVRFLYSGDYYVALEDISEEVFRNCQTSTDGTKTETQNDTDAEDPKLDIEFCNRLLVHIRVNIIADYYGIGPLCNLSAKKVKALLGGSPPNHKRLGLGKLKALPHAIEEAVRDDATYDLMEVLTEHTAFEWSRLREWGLFESCAAIPPFAVMMLDALAERDM